ncbi:hypothetical protein Taro_040187 [Colocasia esculenta]|uniref:SUN domain-containing protein n=1 Tax=Colocasia esculenta TaxID=4460 RepID=A0A843WSB1_COLES|nr:hypothetical protein [Colocasia esculenta]
MPAPGSQDNEERPPFPNNSHCFIFSRYVKFTILFSLPPISDLVGWRLRGDDRRNRVHRLGIPGESSFLSVLLIGGTGGIALLFVWESDLSSSLFPVGFAFPVRWMDVFSTEPHQCWRKRRPNVKSWRSDSCAMQRSRRALLKRRAALENSVYGKILMYKVHLSLVLLSWGLVFLFCSLISHGKNHRDMILGVLIDKSARHEQMHSQVPHSKRYLNLKETVFTLIHNLRDDPLNKNELSVVKRNEHTLSPPGQENVSHQISDLGARALKEHPAESERLSRAAPLGLDEFRSKAITSKGKPLASQVGSLIHRVEPGGKDYNYASAAKGGKVLAFNKEAKGAWNILDKDKNKYLRNPCSAEEKFVVLEISEETLVDTIEIGNFEHYSSNLKDFELLSSLVYPIDTWVKAGKFTAANVKHEQRFALQEPKWARYLRLNLLSHYGSEFYCTLSVLEVYGVDAIERMLEDLISVPDAQTGPEEPSAETSLSSEPNCGDDTYPMLHKEVDSDTGKENVRAKCYTSKVNGIGPGGDSQAAQGGRAPGDAVLKILTQKVQQLDLNLSILEQYLEELNGRYGHIIKDFDNEIADTELLLEHIRVEMKNLHKSSNEFTKDIMELFSWKLLVSLQLETLVRNNAVLRSKVENIHDNQVDMEKRSLAIVFISFFFGSFAFLKLFIDMLLSICRIHKYEKICRLSSAWFILLLSWSMVVLILAL